MTDQKQMVNRVSLALSMIALGLAVVAVMMASRPAAQPVDDSYDRVVAEIWEIMQPVYADFDVAMTQEEQEPETLRDALGPMVRISRALTGGL